MARLKTVVQAICWMFSSRVLRDKLAGKPHKAAIWGQHTCLRGKTRDSGAVEKADVFPLSRLLDKPIDYTRLHRHRFTIYY